MDTGKSARKGKGKSKVVAHGQLHLHAYIRKVLEVVHPGTGIDANSLAIIDKLLCYVADRIACAVTCLREVSQRDTITSREVQTAVRMVIPANLGKHAVSEGVKAISKFTSAAAGSARKVRQQIRAGLKFPVARIGKYLKAQVKCKRKGVGAGIYLAAVMEYMCAEIVALTGNYARDHKRHRITPRAIAMVIANDSEMDHFFGKAIQFGGVLPYIEVAYLPSKSEKGPKSPKSKKSKKSPSPKKATKAKSQRRVNWTAITKELTKMGVGTRFVGSTDHPGAFHYNKLDLGSFAELNESTPSKLYQRYYPWMKTWSAKGIARAVKDTATVDRIWSDIATRLAKAWSMPKNRAVVKDFTSAGVTLDDVEIWYLHQFCDLFLTSADIENLLVEDEIVSDTSPFTAIIEAYGGDGDEDDE